ncbi:unnamed protein product, partial [marine sediment metagenome]
IAPLPRQYISYQKERVHARVIFLCAARGAVGAAPDLTAILLAPGMLITGADEEGIVRQTAAVCPISARPAADSPARARSASQS